MKKFLLSLCLITAVLFLAACFGGTSRSNSSGGEVTGVGGSSITEPTPYGMVLVNKGSLKMGSENTDSLWGKQLPTREISVDAFWMDEHLRLSHPATFRWILRRMGIYAALYIRCIRLPDSLPPHRFL